MTESNTDRQGKELPMLERRDAKCAVGKECQVAKRQTTLSLEVQSVRDNLAELEESIRDMLNIFDDFQTILKVIKGLAYMFKWLAVTGAAILAAWQALAHFGKGHSG